MQPGRGTARAQVGRATGMDRRMHTEDRAATGMDRPAGIGARAPVFPGLSSLSREPRFCRPTQDIRRIRQRLHIAIRDVTTGWFLFAATTGGATAGVMTG